MTDKSMNKESHSLVIKTKRLILRFPVEADSAKFKAFDERNMKISHF